MRAAERHYMQRREGPRVASDDQACYTQFCNSKSFEENNRKMEKITKSINFETSLDVVIPTLTN
jgi:hypothetical protein